MSMCTSIDGGVKPSPVQIPVPAYERPVAAHGMTAQYSAMKVYYVKLSEISCLTSHNAIDIS